MSSSGLATGTGDAAEQEAQYVKGRDAQDIYYWHGGDHQSYFDADVGGDELGQPLACRQRNPPSQCSRELTPLLRLRLWWGRCAWLALAPRRRHDQIAQRRECTLSR